MIQNKVLHKIGERKLQRPHIRVKALAVAKLCSRCGVLFLGGVYE